VKFPPLNRKGPYFGAYIELMLPPNGLKWLRADFSLMKQVAEGEGWEYGPVESLLA
jgi:hypothetical protein